MVLTGGVATVVRSFSHNLAIIVGVVQVVQKIKTCRPCGRCWGILLKQIGFRSQANCKKCCEGNNNSLLRVCAVWLTGLTGIVPHLDIACMGALAGVGYERRRWVCTRTTHSNRGSRQSRFRRFRRIWKCARQRR